MSTVNHVLIVLGIIVTLIGALSFIFPALTKIISAPGNEKIKSIIATIAGIILLIVGLTTKIPLD
jgi:sulfite exporter TauE/SafE